MATESQEQLTVTFTKHQVQLLNRLLEQQQQWGSLDELILQALHEFADRHAGEPKGEEHA